ncbi:acetyltransferase [Paractinoplanes abujensis]|uniref:N-acetylglutamate synthase-like GNAT family acetyltransferase n=1 Tax=Paractinoplanes abujensis TaxID=882441 RepID=A0A7W7CNB8_9ACTN|nr:GNAT family N-acetyltransferase [Actinoplanes abujensis]MBB4691696.1 N-acetylglutamate synthase-like GNAT family acetyltransferase [Actinoplanes abujensis]GID16882.1 acetyltransferase [Actinoplanes abujensis]
MKVRLAAGTHDASLVRDLVDHAFTPYIARIGMKPRPMTADYDAIVAAGRCWVAVDADTIVGMIHLETQSDHLEVETIAVSPAAQGRGVGARLLAFADQRARELGLPEVRLCTNVAMVENIAYYPRRGYVETHRQREDGFSRVFFTKVL